MTTDEEIVAALSAYDPQFPGTELSDFQPEQVEDMRRALQAAEEARLHTEHDSEDAALVLGTITIRYLLTPEDRTQVSYDVEGDLPAVLQMGMLAMAQDTVLHAGEEDQ
ncbi:hypothetical protein SEA_MAGRITTE_173 [Microbacterium phage Magritte]|nr:hypothetical protein SEA_MAGRITTE_173 [Microbacterium phage Magritte]